jgi:stage IV sporulation protein FB
MITIPGKIPIRIHPFFWLLIALIGWISSNTIQGTALWAVVIFFSVLFHEYGHALTAMAFGQRANIDLIATGGLTSRSGPTLKLWQEFLVILNGPLMGFFLYAVALALRRVIDAEQMPVTDLLLQMALFVNLFWTLVNLLPIQPLDGGRLLTVLLEMAMGLRGVKIALFLSMVFAALLAAFFFYANNLLAGSILFLFMFESYRSWRSTLVLTEQDQDSSLQDLLKEAEEAYRTGQLPPAYEKFRAVRERAGTGALYTTASLYMADLLALQGRETEALALLQPLDSKLSADGRMLLLRLLYKTGRYAEAIDLGNRLYHERAGFDVALINAYSQAHQGDARAAVGWLQCAVREGLPDLKSYLLRPEFDPIRRDPAFQELLQK